MAGDVQLRPDDWSDHAKRLRANNNEAQLVAQLTSAMVPASVFGDIEGGSAAAGRLKSAINATVSELRSIGVNIEELASNAIAAGHIAEWGAMTTEQKAWAGKTHRLDVES